MYKILFWYLKRPRLYPELVRHIHRKFFKQKIIINISNKSNNWYESNAKKSNQILEKITGLEWCDDVIDLYSDIIKKAERKVENTPIEMAGFNRYADSQINIVSRSGGGDMDLLYRLSEHISATKVIETGVAYGWSSLLILLSIQNRQNSILISNDMPYLGKDNDQFVGCVVPESLRSRWKLLRYADREGIPRAINKLGEIDLCHYDSDKSYEGRMWAYPRLWEALRPGGIFISDDIGDNVAFKEFTKLIDIIPHIVCKKTSNSSKYIGILIKPFV